MLHRNGVVILNTGDSVRTHKSDLRIGAESENAVYADMLIGSEYGSMGWNQYDERLIHSIARDEDVCLTNSGDGRGVSNGER